MSLRAANGSPLEVLRFVSMQITLGEISRLVDALVIPSLGPDQLLLDNATMSRFGAVLDWKHQWLRFLSTKSFIPAVHRILTPSAKSKDPLAPTVAVAAVHKDSHEQDVALSERVKCCHATVAIAYTNTKPSIDTEVVVEPCILSKTELSHSDRPTVFEHAIVARTVATWRACDGSVDVQVANPSSEHVALPVGLVLGSLSPVTVIVQDALAVHSILSPDI